MNAVTTTTGGEVEGARLRGVTRYAGIPYGHTRRFLPPADVHPWAGVRNATGFGPDAPQNPDPVLPKLIGAAPRPWDEAACLTVNVWTPAADGGRRPVLVWLHGGAFVVGSGSDPWFDGSRLALNQDVVLITVNYRLGAFGFLSTGELLGDEFADAGNLGILDQLAALRWVRENAAAFGGDGDNVTVFGQSAGAMSIAALLVNAGPERPFAKAIMQSGNGRAVRDAASAARVAIDFVDCTGLDRRSAKRLLDLPAQQLLDAQARLLQRYQSTGRGLPFWPVVDGRTLAETPVDGVRRGCTAGIPLVLGTTLDEARLFTGLGAPADTTDDIVLDLLAQSFDDPSPALEIYRASSDATSPLERLAAVATDEMFRVPTVDLADAQARTGTPVWMYLVSWRSPALDGRLGACHSLELPFVFDNLGAPGAMAFCGDRPPQRLAHEMSHRWASFARTGQPTYGEQDSWPAYETTSRRTMIFDAPSRLMDDPQAARRQLWQSGASSPRRPAPALPFWKALAGARAATEESIPSS